MTNSYLHVKRGKYF